MSFSYSVLGLTLECNRPLPYLVADSESVGGALKVDLGDVPASLLRTPPDGWELVFESRWLDERGEPVFRNWQRSEDGLFRLEYSVGMEFFVELEGRCMWARWTEVNTFEDVVTYLMGPVLGFVLRLHGVISLHASAVVIDGSAVAFAGPAGVGKSTTAAAFAEKGYPVLTDDITALRPAGSDFLVQKDNPRLRLWPSSSELLWGSGQTLPRLTPTWDKRFLSLEEYGYRIARRPCPLAAIYLLGGDTVVSKRPAFRVLGLQKALIALVANSYLGNLLDPQMRAHEFDLLTRLVERVVVGRLRRPEGGVPPLDLADFIAEDFRRQRRKPGAFEDPKRSAHPP